MTHRLPGRTTTMVRRLWRCRLAARQLMLLAGGWLLCNAPLQAQPPPPAAPVVSVSRSWYLEALIVAVMIGLALFVVCRSSRRN